MNLPSWGWAILLLVLTLVWFVLPLVPAFWELWRNRDADPVEVDPLGSALIPLSGGSLDVDGAAGPVRLAAGQRFYRVQGSCIRFGRGPWLEDRPDALGVHVAFDERPTTHAGSLTIPRGQTLQGSQVVHGDLVMEESSVLDGSAKVHGQVRMARGCLVTGTVFGMDRMAVGSGGRLRGTVSVQESLHIAAHCALGWADQPVSVSARRIVVGEGTTVHGVIWALIQGRVEAEAA